MTPPYIFSHCPDPATLRRDLVAAQARRAQPPEFATICQNTAAEFRTLARDWYDLGDQGRGDHLTTRGIAWEMAGQTGDLAWVRP